jgi:hypothetical protein
MAGDLLQNVFADISVGMVPEHMFPTGFGHCAQFIFIGERRFDCGRKIPPGRFIEEAVDALLHFPVPGDPGLVDDGDGTTNGRFIVPETIPAQSLGRPDQPSLGAVLVEFLPGEQGRRHIDLDSEAR